MKISRTSSRKQQHINISLARDVSFQTKTAGFDRWDFLHNALPELNMSEVDLSTTFLGKRVALPFIISSMTGGYAEAVKINRQLAEVCAVKNYRYRVICMNLESRPFFDQSRHRSECDRSSP